MILLAFLLTYMIIVQTKTSADTPIVRLNENQTLRGEYRQTFRSNRQISAFVGIPYAEPPVGELRFQPPQEPKSWTGELQLSPVGTEPLCPQFNSDKQVVGYEDCLKLSVYTPENATNLPILIWLHGGGFSNGGAKEYGPQLLLDRDVILATVNYRLGPLGFLSTEDEVIAGNWGLKDQLKAIQWVKKNAQSFGGDPKRIVLGGDDAGGISSHLHTMSQLSRRLLYAVISMSGTALRPDVPTARGAARRRAFGMAERLGFALNLTSTEVAGCLRGAKVEEILKVDTDEGWSPVIEDFIQDIDVAFLEESPITTLENAMTHDVPWLTGFTKSDGNERAPGLFNNSTAIAELSSDFNIKAGEILGYANTAPDPTEVSVEIRNFYFEDGNLTTEVLDQMLLDAWYLAPADEAVRLHAAHSPAATYLYLYTDGEKSSKEDLLRCLFPSSPTSKTENVTAEHKATSEVVLDLWTSFISKRKPMTEKSQTKWKKAESNDLEFIEIAKNGKLLQGKGLLGHRAYLWSSLPRTSHHSAVLQSSIPKTLHTSSHTEL